MISTGELRSRCLPPGGWERWEGGEDEEKGGTAWSVGLAGSDKAAAAAAGRAQGPAGERMEGRMESWRVGAPGTQSGLSCCPGARAGSGEGGRSLL